MLVLTGVNNAYTISLISFQHISGRGAQHHASVNLKPPPGRQKSKSDDEDEDSSSEDEGSGPDNRLGQWIRRRCLDGALNRVPEDFYPNVWRVLEKVCSLRPSSRGVLKSFIYDFVFLRP